MPQAEPLVASVDDQRYFLWRVFRPAPRLYCDPRYYAANVFDPDGYSLEAVYKNWQHQQR
jgi:hypothetical protein